MSFLGGPECSTAGNPLSQFTKHVQDDKSLQRDRLVGRGPAGLQESMRSQIGSVNGDGMLDDFMLQPSQMPQSSSIPITMDHVRRDLVNMQQAPQRNASPHWAAEFDPGLEESARMEAAFQQGKSSPFHAAEFQRYSQIHSTILDRAASPMSSNMNTLTGYQRPMGLSYGGMGMGMGMGMMNMPYSQQPIQYQGKGKERVVELDETDWEAQFAQLTTDQRAEGDLDVEAERAVNAELEAMDRSVSSDLLGDFESIWRRIEAETAANIDRDMLDPDTDWHPGDFSEWDKFDENGLGAHMRDPQLGSYLFEEENLFKEHGDPFGEGVRIMDQGGNLSLAALAFEAAVQQDPQHIEAWARLGAAQAQNEKESPAIRALEQATKLDPTNLDALMGLAVSYTNEGYDSTAYRTLERWLSTKYPSITSSNGPPSNEPFSGDMGFTDRAILHKRVTDLFIRAAQLSPDPTTMDPDVQVGLGVLFYGAEEFDKAVDCFTAALESSETGSTNTSTQMGNQRPLLWNRLGATLANSGRSEEAIQAYENALELNPNFVRARYNLGVSCINIGCYAEAAQHLLGALSMHSVVEKQGWEKARELASGGAWGNGGVDDKDIERIMRQNQSTNLYDTLRRVFGQMNRKDLADKVVAGCDVDVFRGEFDF